MECQAGGLRGGLGIRLPEDSGLPLGVVALMLDPNAYTVILI